MVVVSYLNEDSTNRNVDSPLAVSRGGSDGNRPQNCGQFCPHKATEFRNMGVPCVVMDCVLSPCRLSGEEVAIE